MRALDSGQQRVDIEQLGERLSSLRLAWPAATERMRRALERQGQLTAVVAFDEGGKLELLDGFKRHRAAKQLGWRKLRVRVLTSTPAEAVATIGTLHERTGLTQLEEGWMIRLLSREHGLTQGAIGHLMGRHKSWVSRRLMLVESLEEAVQADVRLGLLSARAAAAVAVLPRGNQQQAAQLVTSQGMTSRQAEMMVARLRQLESAVEREALMSRWPDGPMSPSVKPARSRTVAELVSTDIATIKRASAKLQARLLARPLATLGPSAAQHVSDELRQLAAVLVALERAVAHAVRSYEELDDVQLAHA